MSRIVKAPDIRRQELIDVGFDLYMKSGTAGLSINDIVNKAGVADGALHTGSPLTAGFIVYGLSSILNAQIEINSITKKETCRLVFTLLGIYNTDSTRRIHNDD